MSLLINLHNDHTQTSHSEQRSVHFKIREKKLDWKSGAKYFGWIFFYSRGEGVHGGTASPDLGKKAPKDSPTTIER